MFVKRVSVFVVIALASIAVSNVSAVSYRQFNPDFSSPTLIKHFQCVADTFVDALKANHLKVLWPHVQFTVDEMINLWQQCFKLPDATIKECNSEKGFPAFRHLVVYMYLVEDRAPKLGEKFLRDQEERCGPEGARN